jgi:6-phosphogluconolactonase
LISAAAQTPRRTGNRMQFEIVADAEAAARTAAALIAAEASAAVSARGRFILAVSGGTTPWSMLRMLAGEKLPWGNIHLFQVDERAVPITNPERNITHLRASLERAPLPPDHIHPMPLDTSDLGEATMQYSRALRDWTGSPAVLDLVHLGLGPDGHTASLVPDDPVLDITQADVAITRAYRAHRRMTLTYPIINRSRRILWLVTGGEKAEVLARLHDGDPSIPAGRIRRDRAVVVADQPAANRIAGNRKAEVRA